MDHGRVETGVAVTDTSLVLDVHTKDAHHRIANAVLFTIAAKVEETTVKLCPRVRWCVSVDVYEGRINLEFVTGDAAEQNNARAVVEEALHELRFIR